MWEMLVKKVAFLPSAYILYIHAQHLFHIDGTSVEDDVKAKSVSDPHSKKPQHWGRGEDFP